MHERRDEAWAILTEGKLAHVGISSAATCCIVSPRDRSAGKKQEFEGVSYTIEELTENRCGSGEGRQRLEDLLLACIIMHEGE